MKLLSRSEKLNIYLHQLRSRAYIFAKLNFMRSLSDRAFVTFDYFFFYHKFPNLRNPQTFSEKLQWLKVYGHLEKYSYLVDKYQVREYIGATIGEEYLIPLIGVWERVEDIDFAKLPEKFVLKTTHGSQQVIVCTDKFQLDIESTKLKLKGWMGEDFYKKSREIQYRDCSHRIICEQYLENVNTGLIDYKFYCFDGIPYMVMVVKDRFKSDTESYSFLDLDWNRLNDIYWNQSKEIPIKPDNLDEMIQIAKKLSEGFPFIRVDLYSVEDKVYFGELTFIPSSGLDPNHPEGAEKLLGDLIKLPTKGST